jgi:hypothetical protein
LFRNFGARPGNPSHLPTATYAITKDSEEQHSMPVSGSGKG